MNEWVALILLADVNKNVSYNFKSMLKFLYYDGILNLCFKYIHVHDYNSSHKSYTEEKKQIYDKYYLCFIIRFTIIFTNK